MSHPAYVFYSQARICRGSTARLAALYYPRIFEHLRRASERRVPVDVLSSTVLPSTVLLSYIEDGRGRLC